MQSSNVTTPWRLSIYNERKIFMRVAFVIFIITIIVRMIYDLTWNPLEAFLNILGVSIVSRGKVILRTVAMAAIFIIFAVVWTVMMPDLLAYSGQPFGTESHVLSQMPMYGNTYVQVHENKVGTTTYRYMIKDDNMYSETRQGVDVSFVPADNLQNMVNITYQSPRPKTMKYIFMDDFSWPKTKKDTAYVFAIQYF